MGTGKFILFGFVVFITLLLTGCGLPEEGEGRLAIYGNYFPASEVQIGGKKLLLPEGLDVVKSPNQNLTALSAPRQAGTMLTVETPDQGVVLDSGRGFLAGFAALMAAPPGALDAPQTLSILIPDLDYTWTVSNVLTNLGYRNESTVITQYEMKVPTYYGYGDFASHPDGFSATEISVEILKSFGIEPTVMGFTEFPGTPEGAPKGYDFRFFFTVLYFDANTVMILGSVMLETEFQEFSHLANALGDTTNVLELNDTVTSATDSFTAAGGGGKADILFVIDNSGSMSPYQTAVSQAGSLFFDAMLQSGQDFMTGAITTDSDEVVGGQFTNVLETFKSNIRRGTNGSGIETGIYWAERALQSVTNGGATDGTVTVLGHPRADASMSVIILSDEEDQYNYLSGGKSFDPAANLFVDNGYKVYAIVDPRDESFSLYDELAFATGGTTADINTVATFPAIMEQIALDAAGASSRFILDSIPISSTIKVKVNGVAVPLDSSNGYRFFSSSNSLLFVGSAVPNAGDKITVTYDTIAPAAAKN